MSDEEEVGTGSKETMSQDDVEKLMEQSSGAESDEQTLSQDDIARMVDETASETKSGDTMSQDDVAKMLEEMEQAKQEDGSEEGGNANGVTVDRVQLESFFPGGALAGEGVNLDLLMNISLTVSIELGRTEMLIKDILRLGVGSIVELNKVAGEHIDLLVNNKRFAEGEVVVIEENFGIRITKLLRGPYNAQSTDLGK